MHFVHPQLLWALLLVIIPILIHLFNFRKHKQVYFSSLQFVKAVETSDRKRKNLLHLLLLITRILIIVFIVLAFAQPFFSQKESSTNNEIVYAIYIDNSESMSLNGVSSNLLNEAKENARKVIQQLPVNAKILLNTNLFNAEEGHISNKQELLSRLDYITFSPVSKTKEEIINWQKFQVNLEHPNAKIQHFLLSDFQKKDSRFDQISSDSINSYHPIIFIAQEKRNITIDTVYFESPIHQTGTTANLIFGVRNYSNEAVKNLELQLELGPIKRKLTIDVPANSRKEDKVSYIDFSPGLIKGSISVNDEPFESDNTLFFAYLIKSEIKICVLSESDSYSNIPLLYGLDKHYTVSTNAVNSVNKEIIQEHDLVILNGVHTFTSGVIDDLVQYAKNGGSILVIPSEKSVTNNYNLLLQKLALPQLDAFKKEQQKITNIQQNDLFFKGVFSGNVKDINLPGVSNYFTLRLNDGATILPLIHLQNKTPLFVRHNLKPFYLFSTAIESQQNTITKDPLFPTILLRVAEQANQSQNIYTTLGENGFAPIRKKIDPNKPLYLKNESVEYIPQRVEKDNAFYINVSDEAAIQALVPGVYQIEQNKEIIDYLALNLDRKESDIAAFTIKEVEKMLHEKGIKNVQGMSIDKESDRVYIPVNKETPWWKISIALSLFFILCEIALLIFGKNLRRKDK